MTNLPADRQSAVRPRRAKHELSAVTATALGEHLGLSRQRISALADEGVIERLPDGRFNQDRARLGYLAWLRDPARRSARSEAASDLEKAKAALVWLRVREREGKLMEARKKAMDALFAAEKRRAEPAIARAQSARTIEPILAVVPKLKDLTALELAATGDDKQTFPAFTGVGTRARDLISTALPPLDAQISTIEHRANEPVTGVVAGGWWVNAGRRGLDTPDRTAMEQLLESANQTAAITAQGLMIATSLKGNVGDWRQLTDAANQVATHARNVLEAE